MYVGSTDIRGFIFLLRQIVRFAFYATNAWSFCLELEGPKSGRISFESVCTGINSELFVYARPERTPTGIFDCGLAALNALSSSFHAKLIDEHQETICECKFARGFSVLDPESNGLVFPKKVEIDFVLDDLIFSLGDGLKPNYFIEELRTLAYLYKGRSLFIKYRQDEIPSSALFKYENGLSDLVDLERLRGHIEPLLFTSIEHQFEDFSIDLAFFFRGTSVDTPFLISFVNEERSMEHGAHVAGLVSGILSALVNLQNDVGVDVRSRLNSEGVRKLLVAAVHLKMDEPLFEGSVRNKVINRSIAGPLANFVGEVFINKLKQSLDEASDLVRMIARLSVPY